jgi:hypothetical protein
VFLDPVQVQLEAGSNECNAPGACPPLPRMPAFGVYAVIGDGRRVASSGEAGGHLFVIFSAWACQSNSIAN